MGACASVPKAMRDDNEAPAPEPQKEETVDDKEAMTVEGEENKTKHKEMDKNAIQDRGKNIQSLQSLLNEKETAKELIKKEMSTQAEAVPSEPVNVEKPTSG